MNSRFDRVALGLLAGFALVALSLTYWSVFAADSMLARNDNPRRFEAERTIQRGAIYDRAGELLAQSVQAGRSPAGLPVMRREYPHPEAASAVGYYSLVHSVGGVEAAFDRELRGDDQRDAGQAFLESLLHRPPEGSDIRLTIDLALQTALVEAFGEEHGAAVVIEVNSGAVRALVSMPAFDPNALDRDWDTLRRDPAAPLLNRVIQGVYQPGGALQTVILAAMLTNRELPAEMLIGAQTPVAIDGLTLTCAREPLEPVNTVQRAYAMACPFVFVDAVVNQPGPPKAQEMIEAFGLLRAPPLARFETAAGPAATPLDAIIDQEELRAAAVGQGDLTVTPLQMALVAATIANYGNTVTPYMVDARRAPGTTDWKPIPTPGEMSAVITREVAEALRAAMRESVLLGAALPADPDDILPGTLYGHASIAYTGPRQNANAWFIGFIVLPDGRAWAAAAVVERAADAGRAAAIGGMALTNAARLASP